RRRRTHLPDAGAEAPIDGGQRADRANVDDVHRIRLVERLSRRGNRVVLDAPIRDGELMAAGHLIREAGAACAVDASLRIQHDAGPEGDLLRLVDLAKLEARTFRAVFVGLDLQRAVAGLITDRTVERMV